MSNALGHEDKPGTALRTLYIASLALLFAYFGLWIYALISPVRYRIVFDQLGMTEPSWFMQVLLFLAPVISVISAAVPIVALLLLVSGWPVLKGGSRRTMKRMLLANGCLFLVISAIAGILLAGVPNGR